jgi:alpha-beta hydrolase superfamily lysophospholipase
MRTLTGSSRMVTADDGIVLHERRWAASSARAVLVFVHGIASHGGWFAETAQFLADNGVTVHAPDRRGSGLSGGARGHLPSFERAVSDLDAAVRRAHDDHPAAPVVLGASSWAAKLALVYAAETRLLAGLVLLGPGLFPIVGLSGPRRAEVALTHRVAPLVPVPIPLVPEQYTSNPPYLDFIRADPLRISTVTARFYWETARLDRRRGPVSRGLHAPLLVLQGDADAMMSTDRTRAWFADLDHGDKQYRSYAGAGHTLDFEADRDGYLDDLRSWLWRR